MLSRLTKIQNNINTQDTKKIAEATLSFAKMITKPEMVNQLTVSAKQYIATPEVTKEVCSYLNNNLGTSTIKTNFLASFEYQNKQINYKYKDIILKSKKVEIYDALKEKVAPVRTLVEGPIMADFAEKHPKIKKVVLLGDQVIKNIGSKIKGNTNPDAEIHFINEHQVCIDVKTSSFDPTDVLSGYIRQIDVNSDGSIVTFPRDFSGLQLQQESLLTRLKEQLLFSNIRLTRDDKYLIDHNIYKIKYLINKGKFSLQMNEEIQDSIVNIMTAKSYGRPLNIYNVYHLKNTELTADEMAFLNKIINEIKPEILSKPSYMQAYLIRCLEQYHYTVDKKALVTLKPLAKIFPFIKKLVNTHGAIDFFN